MAMERECTPQGYLCRWRWLAIAILLAVGIVACDTKDDATIKVGILHSMSGTMAFSERDLVDVLIMAIEEINASGGVLGRQLEPVLADGASNWWQFSKEAERLIVQERVAVLFGCWTSSSRIAVKPIVERYEHLLFYPLQYEGLEQSPNIIYTGATPNQQIIPGVHWALENIGQSVYLLGSDYIFPRAANMLIKDQLKNRGIEPLGEMYLPLGSSDISRAIEDIRRLKPDLVFNTINGDSNIAFFNGLSGLQETKVVSFSIAEPEVLAIGIDQMLGHYAVWNYFQSIDSPENRQFVSAFKARFGKERVVNDPMEATYIGIKLWVQGVAAAGTFDPLRVKHALGYQSLNAPQGIVSVDMGSQHLWKTVRIGRVQSDGQFEIVWRSDSPIRPTPFPKYHSRSIWLQRLQELKYR
ncbi:ABC transporter substrate-binding protein [Shewanella canadensis]|uniref:ABC transporter substrate-binding protein n=1 Tax=Shewanella canadensis TaxID=271096 RepID=A0A3S0LPA2_9GAMM|nr:urea ABC transporter substrate-binding protein [Shewanella canadensis]RTR40177.1 ABC transporter substrate-binding protein [Shewanella canadensis]